MSKSISEKVITVISFLVMLLMNILANVTAISGRSTATISKSYPNLFTPANYTFDIWIIIYLLLAVFALYQLDLFGKNRNSIKPKVFIDIRRLFIITSIGTTVWTLAWQYDYLAFALMLTLLILICLDVINRALSLEKLTLQEKLFIRLPFSIYFGWITVTTIMHLVILFVSIRFQGFRNSEPVWTIALLIFTLGIVSYRAHRNKDIAYCLTVIWAYVGILVKHTSQSYLDRQYPQVIYTVIFCLLLLVAGAGILIYKKRND